MNLGKNGLLHIIGFLVLLAVYSCKAAPQPLFKNRNLIPFPRVGRRDTSQDIDDPDKLTNDYFVENKIRKNGNKSLNSGIWFGPRLGRIQKRKSYLDDAMGYLLLRDLDKHTINPYKHSPKYTPRLGRDSEEILDELSESNQTIY